MTRKARTKKETNDDAKRVRRKFTAWDTDRMTPVSPSSLEVLMTWLKIPGNADRWRRDKGNVCGEICEVLQANGISHRERGDVQYKIRYMYNQFMNATKHLSEKNELETFQRGSAHPEVVDEVLKICPQYKELLPCFGKNLVARKAQLTVASATNGAATDSTVSSNKSAAGEWKKNLEKDVHKAVSDEKKRVNGEKMAEKSGNNGSASIVRKVKETHGDQTGESKTEQNRIKENGSEGKSESTSAVDKRLLDSAKDVSERDAVGEDDVGEEDKSEEDRQHHASSAEHVNGVEGEESVLADVEKSQGSADEENQSSDDDEEDDTIVEQEEPQADAESEDESSEEEVKPRSRVGVRSPFKTKPKQSESEESSAEEEDSDEAKSDSESEREEGDDGDERIPLAQPDEMDAATPTEAEEEEQVEQIEVDETANEQVDADEESEEEEEPEQDNSKAAAESSEDSDSNSSESESEDGEKDEEVPPTQVKAPSDQEEESEDGSKNEEDDGDDDIDEDTHNAVERSDRDVEMIVEQSASGAESDSPQSTRKRSSANKSSSPTTKRARRGNNSNDATRDLEREAFIERAKQERDQRDELFQLERAKLECELQAKQVQLAMERSLARKKLLGAGIDPNEINRVLPL